MQAALEKSKELTRASASSSSASGGKSFGVVLGGKLNFKGGADLPGKKKKKKRKDLATEAADDADDDDAVAAMLAAHSSDPVAGEGKLTSSGVVCMGTDASNFTSEIVVGDSILVTVSDRYRNISSEESRVVNMVLGKSSLNLEAPFSCDVTDPTNFMILKKAPDLEAFKAARAEERKRAKRLKEDSQEVTYKVVKAGSGTWKKWETVTEKVQGGMSREQMLQKRIEHKADCFCK